MRRGNLLTTLIIISLVLGVIIGQILYVNIGSVDVEALSWLREAGNIVLIRPLMLMIIPLIFVSVVVGVSSLGDPAKLGLVGGATILYYMTTMLLAVTIGTSLVSLFKPGVGLPPETTAAMIEEGTSVYAARADFQRATEVAEQEGLGGVWLNIVYQFVPDNLFQDMVERRPPGVIVFALLLGLGLAAAGTKARPAIEFFEALFAGLMKLILWIIWLTPIGVLFLVSWSVGTIGLTQLGAALSKYMLVVFCGLLLHALVALPLVMYFLTRRNPFVFMWQMRKALLTAFGTSSSYATLPVTIQSAELEGGCSKRSANFVLPLGSTINMDGTALYSAVAVIFLFQLFGIDLSFGDLLIIVITGTLAAVGAAGIPSAGLITMVIIIAAVNTSVAGRGIEGATALPVAAIGIIIGVDRILDMCRTTVNVWGDAIGAKVMTRLVPDTDDERAEALG